jgi:hypothetical protein
MDNHPVAKTQQDLFREIKLKESKDIEDIIFEGLVVRPSLELNVIPEHIFVEYFLPFFAGVYKLESKPSIITEWISIAGTPMAQVAVIDHNRKVLFTVPPLFNTGVINSGVSDSNKSYKDSFVLAEMHNANIPNSGLNILVDALNDKFDTLIKPDTAISKFDQQWKDIFARYADRLGIKVEHKVVKEDKLDDDELIY